jgi:hypothetical protein
LFEPESDRRRLSVTSVLRDGNFVQMLTAAQIKFKLSVAGRLHPGATYPKLEHSGGYAAIARRLRDVLPLTTPNVAASIIRKTPGG